MSCIFCQIVKGEIAADIVFENERIIAFNDIKPVAPVHVLIIPKTHIPTTNDVDSTNYMIAGELLMAASEIAAKLNIAQDGYRLVFNCNENGGQEVFHIHLHLIGGKKLGWPPC